MNKHRRANSKIKIKRFDLGYQYSLKRNGSWMNEQMMKYVSGICESIVVFVLLCLMCMWVAMGVYALLLWMEHKHVCTHLGHA